jgi:hypothetical protein
MSDKVTDLKKVVTKLEKLLKKKKKKPKSKPKTKTKIVYVKQKSQGINAGGPSAGRHGGYQPAFQTYGQPAQTVQSSNTANQFDNISKSINDKLQSLERGNLMKQEQASRESTEFRYPIKDASIEIDDVDDFYAPKPQPQENFLDEIAQKPQAPLFLENAPRPQQPRTEKVKPQTTAAAEPEIDTESDDDDEGTVADITESILNNSPIVVMAALDPSVDFGDKPGVDELILLNQNIKERIDKAYESNPTSLNIEDMTAMKKQLKTAAGNAKAKPGGAQSPAFKFAQYRILKTNEYLQFVSQKRKDELAAAKIDKAALKQKPPKK